MYFLLKEVSDAAAASSNVPSRKTESKVASERHKQVTDEMNAKIKQVELADNMGLTCCQKLANSMGLACSRGLADIWGVIFCVLATTGLAKQHWAGAEAAGGAARPVGRHDSSQRAPGADVEGAAAAGKSGEGGATTDPYRNHQRKSDHPNSFASFRFFLPLHLCCLWSYFLCASHSLVSKIAFYKILTLKS